jgi:hypothetical protein
MHLMNMLIEKLCVQQSVNVVEAYFLQPIISTKFKYEREKTRSDFSVVRHVIFHDLVNQKEHELREHYSNNELVQETDKENLEIKK